MNMKRKILIIIGGKSTGLEIREVVDSYYSNFFDDVYNVISVQDDICPYPAITDNEMELLIEDFDLDLYYIISMTNYKLRMKFISLFKSKNMKPFNVIHPKAEISKSVLLGENIYVASGVIISSFAKVEDNVLLNFGVLIGHDSIIKENCILLPGSKIGGGVVLNENVLIGSGTFIKQGVSIGKNTFIDAMCYIEKNIEENKMCRSKIEIKQYKNIFL
jgi:UDP-3-O-[3-hydroxymyristoyl] glucosamine N-acyltransferase